MSQYGSGVGSPARDLAMQLAERVEAFCRYYLSNGHRSGRYWIVGDTANTRGRSLFVRLIGRPHGQGSRGKWQDAATGEHGDLLDLIAAREGHRCLAETMAEARRFLGRPDVATGAGYARNIPFLTRMDTSAIARRIWDEGKPLSGMLAETYLCLRNLPPPYPRDLRFHACLEYRDHNTGEIAFHPALLAAVRDAAGGLRGIQRCWLASDGQKAAFDDPRRSLGHIHGNGVWLHDDDRAHASGTLLVGEGVETVLSLARILPSAGMVAALSASHLAGFILPGWVRHLLIARDSDPAGLRAARKLASRAAERGIEVSVLRPVLKDFNADLRLLGRDVLVTNLQRQWPDLLAA
ncbi:MAG: toprim domain-containing protein [Methylobacterium sp.]|nr:toprim domain-containing protein [Methylobacterium sp.]